ncbi:hypothetical protein [Streptomyces carpinensis]|uniref:Uncharacterized protein n=1 Tax=Streptomyces carpinensis TaxID=66369 RepID=A0ABV1WA83_9ACTN|nr:hypothetical protein [Streptomyces carpinensis]
MFNRSGGRAERKGYETRVTRRRRQSILVAIAASVAGIGLGICLFADIVTPDEATAVSSVGSATTAVVALSIRRGPGADPGEGGAVSLDK